MAGQLTIDTLKASSGVLATQNGMTGIVKAWAYFNGSTLAVANSFNVSSITRIGTGQFYVNFTTAMPNANYCLAGSTNDNAGIVVNDWVGTTTTSSAAMSTYAAGTAYNFSHTQVIIIGS